MENGYPNPEGFIDLTNKGRHESMFDRYSLDLSAFTISSIFNHQISVHRNMNKLDALANESRTLAGAQASQEALLESLRTVLFEKHGYTGNKEDYYAPENSYLDWVIQSRRGIPISLSILMIEVGRRLSLPIVGIALPCHFITGFLSVNGARYFDPFHGGVERTRDECINLVEELSDGQVHISPTQFEPATKRVILARLLSNLKTIFKKRNDRKKLATALELLLLLNPTDPKVHAEVALNLVDEGKLAKAYEHIQECSSMRLPAHAEKPLRDAARKIREIIAVLN